MNRKRLAAAGLVLAAAAWALGPLASRPGGGLDARGFGELPVLHSGRLKPLDTVARSSLLAISGRQQIPDSGSAVSADQWLIDVIARPQKADRYAIFTVDHPELLALADLPPSANRRFSFSDLQKSQEAIERQAQSAPGAPRSRFQEAALNLAEHLNLYTRLKSTVWPEGLGSMAQALSTLPDAAKDSKKAAGLVETLRFSAWAAIFRPVAADSCSEQGFVDTGSAALAALSSQGQASPGAWAYARLRDAAAAKDTLAFNEALSGYKASLERSCPRQTAWARHEALFNRLEPFYRGMVLYLLSLLLLSAAWLLKSPELERAAVRLTVVAFTVHSAGLIFRTVLQGRPPVTNLYSSAVFVGWVAVGAGLIFERLHRRGLAAMGANVIGFITLIIAHHLATQGDTVEMMRAVLDSNFWLATHVVTITIGYGAGLLAATLAHVALAKMAWPRRGAPAADAALIDMIYALLCACLVMSFIGTVLGGIWADRSWGRFWGWDPKENGALLIVLWNAMALHARWGGFIRQKGLVFMAILGGVVTALAWFGVNMLGVGLHSYGFTSGAFYGLAGFVTAELLIVAGSALWLSRASSPITGPTPA